MSGYPLGAKMAHRAAAAFRGTGGAYIPSEQYNPVTEVAAFFRG